MIYRKGGAWVRMTWREAERAAHPNIPGFGLKNFLWPADTLREF